MTISIVNGRFLSPEGALVAGDLAIEDGLISTVGAAGSGLRIDAAGLLVLPGIVDLHGDAFERQLMPRPGVHFAAELALLDTDRQMLANGITTAYHGLTWSWEPGLRGTDAALAFVDALAGLRARLGCDTRLHLRFETFNLDAVDTIAGWLAEGVVDLLAFNNHFPEIAAKTASEKVKFAERARLSAEAFEALLQTVGKRADAVPEAVTRLAGLARSHGVVMASHDDADPETRHWYHRLGAYLCEFPENRETADTARGLGDAIIMGAPNVVRGGSHLGGMSAAEMAGQGLCEVLSSDYYYPSLLQAPFRLQRDQILPFPQAWSLVSAGPARLAGLCDRGDIAPGKRADLILVDARDPGLPQVVATFIAGAPAHSAGNIMLRCA